MATRTIPAVVVSISDVSGVEGTDETPVTTVDLGELFAGVTADLTDAERDAFEVFANTLDAEPLRAVVAPAPVRRTRRTREESDKIRAFGRENGYEVGDKGRIAADLVVAYYRAQNGADPA